jgi:peptidoglycan/xylan/chitin deacetylase (PgdA/CDA1 family)
MSDVLVLCYHAVSPTWDAELSITPEALERQLTLLAGRGYRGATFADAVAGRPSGRTVVVTFDDAYRSVGTLAAPILERLGMPATVFVPTDWPAAGAPMVWPGIDHWPEDEYREELTPLTWDELGALRDRGWEVASHTCSHPHLTTLSDAELDRELVASRAAVEEHMGAPCRTIAYPYGDQDERVRRAAERAGYAGGAALERWLREGDPFAWPRVGVYHADDERRFRLKASRPLRRLRGSAAIERLLTR